MLDSIEIQQGEKKTLNSPQIINQLKQNLKQENSPKNNNLNNNPQNVDDFVNYKLSSSEQINPKKSKSLQKKSNSTLKNNTKNAYNNFIQNIRATTPILNNISNSNINPSKSKIKSTSSFSRTLNNFFQKNKLLINDDDDNTSIINDDPIKLRNQFQHYLGKANEKTTKEISFQKLKEIINNNHTTDNLRVYISCLSTYSRNATVFGMEIYALLYGYISGVYKENLMDPIDNPPNIIKTINRILNHLKQFYLGNNSYMVHKSISRSMCDIYDNCMPKDNIKSIYMIFLEPLFDILSSGNEKSTQEGAAICLMDFIYHLGENRKKNNINKKILDTIDEKIISLCTKSSLDNPYLFEALYNLINFNKIENFSNYLKEIYDRFVVILCKSNKNKYNYLMKLNCLKILNLIGNKIRNIADISIGYYQEEILKVIEYNTKDKNTKVQLQAKKTLKTWKELKKIYEDIDIKKREIKDNLSKEDFIKNTNDDDDEDNIDNINDNDNLEENEIITNENNNYNIKNKNFGNIVRKMDKLNFLRNLAKRAKIENQKIDYDSQLPEKMKEEVYKKGISNILNFSKFLKNRLQMKESNEFKENEVSPKNRSKSKSKSKNKKNKFQKEIKNYLKNSKQVKKYDSIKKMEHDNIISKNKQKENFNENENIIPEVNENSNYNNNNINNNNLSKEENEENINNNNNNFIEEEKFEGQNNFQQNENMENNNNINNYIEENKNKEEIVQENQEQIDMDNQKENNENDNEIYNNENEININKNNLNNNSQISDTKNSNLNIINNINEDNMKNNLQNLFNEIILKSFDDFEKNLNLKINQMNNRINDIALKISDYQSNQINNINNNSNNNISKNKKGDYYNYSQSSYKPLIENNNSFYINSKKMKLNSIRDSKNNSIYTEEPDYYINNTLNKKEKIDKENTSIDSEVTKTWKDTLKLIEKGNINEGYLKLINSGDDIYLLRLICLTGPIIDKLDIEIAKRVLIRVNMISKSHQIQQLLIGLIKNSIKNNIFRTLEPNQQNYILDSLYEFSGLNNSLASEAAELYAELTK